MKKPMLYSADQIKNWDIDKKITSYDGIEYWQPARPEGRSTLKARFILAYNVFVGEYDALYWKD